MLSAYAESSYQPCLSWSHVGGWGTSASFIDTRLYRLCELEDGGFGETHRSYCFQHMLKAAISLAHPGLTWVDGELVRRS